MKRYRIDYTIESSIGRSVIVEGEDEYDALNSFDTMREDLIIDNADEVRRIGNMCILDDVSWEEID
jgi:hypothetical protein